VQGGGCGKKAAPTAPVAVAPAKIKDLVARPRGGAVVLRWSIPEKNTDGTELSDLRGFAILRSEQPFQQECPDCPKRFSVLYDIDYQTYMMNRPQSLTIDYSDSGLTFKTVYTYRVTSYNAGKHLSPPATTADIFWDIPSSPPLSLRAELEGKTVVLSWEAPSALQDGTPLEGPVAYNLYRRTPGTSYSFQPINDEPITTLSCRDRGVISDTDYLYTLRALRQVRETAVESEACEELSINTTDRTPPRSPTGLIAVPTTTGIALKWDENEEEDLAGYNIYRRTAGEAGFMKLTDVPLLRGGFADGTVVINSTYTYTVTALDGATEANESEPSAGLTITYTY
jgi:hypothetical protein